MSRKHDRGALRLPDTENVAREHSDEPECHEPAHKPQANPQPDARCPHESAPQGSGTRRPPPSSHGPSQSRRLAMIQNARLPTRESDSQEVSASGGRRLRGVSPPRGHPRMRGEHRQAGPTPAAVRGIIPACAGSTWQDAFRKRLNRDHPRMRGEHYRPVPSRLALPGSSPHARGALGLRDHRRDDPGTIPACVGSTRPREGTERRPGGSTPHARGAPTRLPPSAADVRDHPRMRGEHSMPIA